VHANAPLTPQGRLRMCHRIEAGYDIGEVVRFMLVSRQTASKWWNRYQCDGEAGLVDRRSTPHRSPARISLRRERRIIGLRVSRRWGPEQIAAHLGMNPSTVWRGVETLRDFAAASPRSGHGRTGPTLREGHLR